MKITIADIGSGEIRAEVTKEVEGVRQVIDLIEGPTSVVIELFAMRYDGDDAEVIFV